MVETRGDVSVKCKKCNKHDIWTNSQNKDQDQHVGDTVYAPCTSKCGANLTPHEILDITVPDY